MRERESDRERVQEQPKGKIKAGVMDENKQKVESEEERLRAQVNVG